MADTFRLKLLKNLTAVLEGITPANGFQHDMTGKVFRGRIKYGPDDPLPMISILEAPIPLEATQSASDYEQTNSRWELLVQGFVDDDFKHPSDPAHHLMGEVKAALIRHRRESRGNDIFSMGGRVASMSIGQGSVRPADEASDKAFFWLTLTLRVVENLADPYE